MVLASAVPVVANVEQNALFHSVVSSFRNGRNGRRGHHCQQHTETENHAENLFHGRVPFLCLFICFWGKCAHRTAWFRRFRCYGRLRRNGWIALVPLQ